MLDDDKDDDPFDKYDFWRSFKAQVQILRDDMSSGKSVDAAAGSQEGVNAAYEELLPLLDAMKLHAHSGTKPKENAAHFPLIDQGVAIGPQNPFMRSGADAQPSVAFGMFRSPMKQDKVSDAKGGVWGRDMV